ncbi:CAP-associated domain-containing protein [Enterococcus timonensis]|uniref:CAP-associated domain-containing protein n=1 Tax=Enterococcus timonensis TaxID=1852364 RepID=UPI0008DA2F95|nr:CAP-associated domain-containing protein [Enterococcus timonensis]
MKKIGQFFVIFLLVIIFVYGYAALFPSSKNIVKSPIISENTVNAMPYTKIPVNQYAELIGASEKKLTDELGAAEKVTVVSEERTVYSYGTGYNDFFQVTVENNIVTEMYSLGQKNENEPFYFKMDTAQLSELTPLAATFRLEFLPDPVEFELTEEDLNYRPLVAFDNDSFAIFYFDATSGELLAIRYLSAEKLVEILPYQLNEGTKFQRAETLRMTENEQDLWKSNLYRNALDILRQREELSTLGNLFDNEIIVRNMTQQLVQNKEAFLTAEEVHDFNASQVLSDVPLVISGKRFEEISQSFGLGEINNGQLQVPVKDPLQTAIEDFIFGKMSESYHQADAGILSVAFQEEVMVTLLTETKLVDTTSTDSLASSEIIEGNE